MLLRLAPRRQRASESNGDDLQATFDADRSLKGAASLLPAVALKGLVSLLFVATS
jgi:hypothetical protein